MKRPDNYDTRQRKAIVDYIASLEGAHVTAAQIAEHFGQGDVAIGRTTIYRHLDKLVQSGQVRRYTTDGIAGACYQYVGDSESCNAHIHLKCDGCGGLFHSISDDLDDIQRYVSDKYAFQINNLKTVLYGECESCSKQAKT